MSPPSETHPAGGTLWLALATTVSAAAAPYGYTVTLWSSGALLVRAHGLPRAPEVFELAVGALLAYSLLALVVCATRPGSEARNNVADRVLAGALNWLAAGVAVGAVALLSTIHGWVAWPVSSFAATFLYLISASVQLVLVNTISNRR